MEKAGKDPKAIKMATGWERGADRKWRYEVDDGGFGDGWFDLVKNGGTKRLSDVIENERLFEAYPELRNMAVVIVNRLGASGNYDHTNKIINIDRGIIGKENVLSTFHHEIQHAIQGIEGFAKGGRPGSFVPPDGYKRDMRNLTHQVIDFYSNTDIGNTVRHEQEEWSFDYYERNGKYPDKESSSFAKFKDEQVKKYPAYQEIRSYEKMLDNKSRKPQDEVEAYKRLSGEVEARNVSDRMNMSPEQRRATLAAETEDISREDQIFINQTFDGAQAYLDDKNLENGGKSSTFAESNSNLQNIKNNAKQINDGDAVYERFSQREQRGLTAGGSRHVEASLIAGRSVSTRETQDERADRIEEEVEGYARDAGIWRDNTEEYLTNLHGKPINSGQESLVFYDGKKAIKTSNILQDRDLQDALDGVTLHNISLKAKRRLPDSVWTKRPDSKSSPNSLTLQKAKEWLRNQRLMSLPKD